MKPFDRLKFWTVAHELRHRLEPYQVSEVARPFRRMSWNDLRYWALLIDEDDAGLLRAAGIDPDAEIPTPEEWFGEGIIYSPPTERITEYSMSCTVDHGGDPCPGFGKVEA